MQAAPLLADKAAILGAVKAHFVVENRYHCQLFCATCLLVVSRGMPETASIFFHAG